MKEWQTKKSHHLRLVGRGKHSPCPVVPMSSANIDSSAGRASPFTRMLRRKHIIWPRMILSCLVFFRFSSVFSSFFKNKFTCTVNLWAVLSISDGFTFYTFYSIYYLLLWCIFFQCQYRWLTAQRCYVHLLTNMGFWYPVIAPAFSYLWTKCEILMRYRNEEKWHYWRSSSNLSGCAKVLCPFHSFTKVLSLSVDLIHRPTLGPLLCDM